MLASSIFGAAFAGFQGKATEKVETISDEVARETTSVDETPVDAEYYPGGYTSGCVVA